MNMFIVDILLTRWVELE